MNLIAALVVRCVVCISAALHAPAITPATPPGMLGIEAQKDDCSADSLSQAVAIDVSHLRHRRKLVETDQATGGEEVTVYYDADRPRMAVVKFGGEMGQTTLRYYLTSSSKYVVDWEEIRYGVPITVQATPRVVSRLRAVVYVCDSTTVDPLTREKIADIRMTLDSALIKVAKAH
jgi:hypothetical protein